MSRKRLSMYDLDIVASTYRHNERVITGVDANESLQRLSETFSGFFSRHSVKGILEVGCGGGAILHRVIAGMGTNDAYCVGVDLSWNQIDFAHKDFENIHNASFTVGDGASLPLKSKTFDIVYEYSSLSQCSEPAKFITEMSRVARGLVSFSASISNEFPSRHICFFETFKETPSGLRPLRDISQFGEVMIDERLLRESGEPGVYKYPVWAQYARTLTEDELDRILDDSDFVVVKKFPLKAYDIIVLRNDDHSGPLVPEDTIIGREFDHCEVVLERK